MLPRAIELPELFFTDWALLPVFKIEGDKIYSYEYGFYHLLNIGEVYVDDRSLLLLDEVSLNRFSRWFTKVRFHDKPTPIELAYALCGNRLILRNKNAATEEEVALFIKDLAVGVAKSKVWAESNKEWVSEYCNI